MIGTIYLIGCFIALVLGIRLLYKEERKKEKEKGKEKEKTLQYGMLAPLTLMSWFSVFIVLWKLRDKLV